MTRLEPVHVTGSGRAMRNPADCGHCWRNSTMRCRLLQIVRTYRGEFGMGRWKAGWIHVGSTPREIVRECRRALTPQSRSDRSKRLARLAFYAGAIIAARANARLYSACRF